MVESDAVSVGDREARGVGENSRRSHVDVPSLPASVTDRLTSPIVVPPSVTRRPCQPPTVDIWGPSVVVTSAISGSRGWATVYTVSFL